MKKPENVPDPRSTLEREFDTSKPLDGVFLRRLIGILKRERDCMTFNWKAAEKENRNLSKSNERWKFFRSLLPFVTKTDLKELEQRIQERLLMTQKELQASLDALSDQLDKATKEITSEIDTLKAELADVPISDAAKASLDRLTTKVQALDDLNPDAEKPPTPPGSPLGSPPAQPPTA